MASPLRSSSESTVPVRQTESASPTQEAAPPKLGTPNKDKGTSIEKTDKQLNDTNNHPIDKKRPNGSNAEKKVGLVRYGAQQRPIAKTSDIAVGRTTAVYHGGRVKSENQIEAKLNEAHVALENYGRSHKSASASSTTELGNKLIALLKEAKQFTDPSKHAQINNMLEDLKKCFEQIRSLKPDESISSIKVKISDILADIAEFAEENPRTDDAQTRAEPVKTESKTTKQTEKNSGDRLDAKLNDAHTALENFGKTPNSSQELSNTLISFYEEARQASDPSKLDQLKKSRDSIRECLNSMRENKEYQDPSLSSAKAKISDILLEMAEIVKQNPKPDDTLSREEPAKTEPQTIQPQIEKTDDVIGIKKETISAEPKTELEKAGDELKQAINNLDLGSLGTKEFSAKLEKFIEIAKKSTNDPKIHNEIDNKAAQLKKQFEQGRTKLQMDTFQAEINYITQGRSGETIRNAKDEYGKLKGQIKKDIQALQDLIPKSAPPKAASVSKEEIAQVSEQERTEEASDVEENERYIPSEGAQSPIDADAKIVRTPNKLQREIGKYGEELARGGHPQKEILKQQKEFLAELKRLAKNGEISQEQKTQALNEIKHLRLQAKLGDLNKKLSNLRESNKALYNANNREDDGSLHIVPSEIKSKDVELVYKKGKALINTLENKPDKYIALTKQLTEIKNQLKIMGSKFDYEDKNGRFQNENFRKIAQKLYQISERTGTKLYVSLAENTTFETGQKIRNCSETWPSIMQNLQQHFLSGSSDMMKYDDERFGINSFLKKIENQINEIQDSNYDTNTLLLKYSEAFQKPAAELEEPAKNMGNLYLGVLNKILQSNDLDPELRQNCEKLKEDLQDAMDDIRKTKQSPVQLNYFVNINWSDINTRMEDIVNELISKGEPSGLSFKNDKKIQAAYKELLNPVETDFTSKNKSSVSSVDDAKDLFKIFIRIKDRIDNNSARLEQPDYAYPLIPTESMAIGDKTELSNIKKEMQQVSNSMLESRDSPEIQKFIKEIKNTLETKEELTSEEVSRLLDNIKELFPELEVNNWLEVAENSIENIQNNNVYIAKFQKEVSNYTDPEDIARGENVLKEREDKTKASFVSLLEAKKALGKLLKEFPESPLKNEFKQRYANILSIADFEDQAKVDKFVAANKKRIASKQTPENVQKAIANNFLGLLGDNPLLIKKDQGFDNAINSINLQYDYFAATFFREKSGNDSVKQLQTFTNNFITALTVANKNERLKIFFKTPSMVPDPSTLKDLQTLKTQLQDLQNEINKLTFSDKTKHGAEASMIQKKLSISIKMAMNKITELENRTQVGEKH